MSRFLWTAFKLGLFVGAVWLVHTLFEVSLVWAAAIVISLFCWGELQTLGREHDALELRVKVLERLLSGSPAEP